MKQTQSSNNWHIESVTLSNFLSHSKNTYSFKRGLNVIFGPNGSGKSSLLDALGFVLNENKTRYASWRQYIQRGKKKTEVAFKFQNGIQSILIGRKLELKGGVTKSTYFLDGKQISLSGLKEKLRALSLYINNPLLIVKQATITELMGDLKPLQIRRSIETATGLDILVSNYQNLSDESIRQRQLGDKLQVDINRANDIITDLTKMQKKVNYFYQLKAELDSIEREIAAWRVKTLSTVKKHLEAELKALQAGLITAESRISQINVELEQLRQEIQTIGSKYRNQVEHLGGLRVELTNLRSQSSNLLNDISTLATQYHLAVDIDKIAEEITTRKGTQQNIIQDELKYEADFDLSTVEDIIRSERERKNSVTNQIEHVQGRLAEIDKNRKTMQDNWEQVKTTLITGEYLQLDQPEFSEATISVELLNKIEQIKRDLSYARVQLAKDIFQLGQDQKKQKNLLTAYQESDPRKIAPKDVQQIHEYITSQNLETIGPVLWYLQPKKLHSNEIEQILRFTLSKKDFYTFICYNEAARKQILKYCRQNNLKPSLYTIKQHRPIDSLSIPKQKGVYGRLIDQIECSSEIKRFLYYRMRNLIGVKNQTIADRFAKDGHICITLDGFRTQETKYEIKDDRRHATEVHFLQTSNSKLIVTVEQELTNITTLLTQKEVQNDQLSSLSTSLDLILALKEYFMDPKLVKTLGQELKVSQQEKAKLSHRISQLERLQTIQSELEGLNKILSVFESQDQNQKLIEQCEQQIKSVEQIVVALEKTTADKENRKASVIREQSILEKNLTESSETIADMESQLSSFTQEIQINADIARDTKPNTPPKELEKREGIIQREIQQLGPLDLEVESRLDQKKQMLVDTQSQLKEVKLDIEKLSERIDETAATWRTEFDSLLPRLTLESNRLLDSLAMKLTIRMPKKTIEEATLTIDVDTQGQISPFSSFSGGEKSIIAMALILALQRVKVKQKICILDEFDQSLDDINTEFLRNSVQKLSQDSQYIILTPAKSRGLLEGAARLIGVYKLKNQSQLKIWEAEDFTPHQ